MLQIEILYRIFSINVLSWMSNSNSNSISNSVSKVIYLKINFHISKQIYDKVLIKYINDSVVTMGEFRPWSWRWEKKKKKGTKLGGHYVNFREDKFSQAQQKAFPKD